MPENGSSYKKALLNLAPGEFIYASQLAGDFLLPKIKDKKAKPKLGFIAGGIGITPFISHLHNMSDTKKYAEVDLYYCCENRNELVYKKPLEKLNLPLSIIPVIGSGEATKDEEPGRINVDMIKRRTPDFLERVWYMSGPPGMVDAYSSLLRQLGVPSKNIKKDFFSGI